MVEDEDVVGARGLCGELNIMGARCTWDWNTIILDGEAQRAPGDEPEPMAWAKVSVADVG